MQARRVRFHLNRKAVFYGCITDIGASVVAGILLTVVVASGAGNAAALRDATDSTGYGLASFVLGLAATGLGGYVAARFAPRLELTHALAVGVVMTAFGLLASVVLVRTGVTFLDALTLILTLPAALVGGMARLSQVERVAAS